MSNSCPRPDEFGAIAELPEIHPLRRHVTECTRCQVIWRSYRAFLEDEFDPPGSRTEEADSALRSTIEDRFGRPPVERLRSKSELSRSVPRWWLPSKRSGLALRRALLWAPAAAVVIGLFLVTTRELLHRPTSAPLRGANTIAWRTEPPLWLPDGGLRLRWPARPGADGYRLTIYDSSLQPLHAAAVGAETTLVLSRSEIDSWHATDRTTLWRVTATRQGEVLEESEVGSMAVP